MSYCRWSTDDFQCDLYVYESEMGYMIHVAHERYKFAEPLPAPLATHASPKKQIARYIAVMSIVKRSESEPIGLPHDGETFVMDNPRDCAKKIKELVAMGYRCPNYVAESLIEEADAEDMGPWHSMADMGER